MRQRIRNNLKKRKVKIFLVFLFCSTSAWFISNLSEPYISTTTFELAYVNRSDELMLVSASQDKTNVKLEAVGFQFLGFDFKKKNVEIDLSEVVKKGGQYYLPYKKYQAQIEKQLPTAMRLIDMDKDILFFDFQKIMTKKVPVVPTFTLKLAKNYLLDGNLKIKPSEVILKGPRNEVDTINEVKSYPIELKDLTSDFFLETLISIPDGLQHTTFSKTSVTVAGKILKFSEKIITVKVKALNIPSGTSVKMFPDEVTILCKGSIARLKDLVASNFEVVADFDEIKRNHSKKIAVRISKIPELLSSAVLQESEIEYIVKRE